MENKFMSLEWFKSSTERAIEKVVANKLESLIEKPEHTCKAKLYLNVKLVNDTLIIVLLNGEIINKAGATEQDFNDVLTAKSIEDVMNIVTSEKVKEERITHEAEVNKIKALQKGIQTLSDLPDFDVIDNVVYLTGTSRSMPQLLVEKFIEIVDRVKYYKGLGFTPDALNENDDYLAHKNFFMWCCLNPRAEVANELYRFLTDNSFKITKQGFFVALRNVVTLHGSPELVYFISNAYNKVKAVWKKNPDDYTIFLEEGEYKLVHKDNLTKTETHTSTTCPDCLGDGGWYSSDNCNDWDDEKWEDCERCDGTGEVEEYTYTEEWPINHGQRIGTLTEIYLDLPNREENRFTDNYTRTFDIRVGQVVSMPKEECNWSTQDCATAGLK